MNITREQLSDLELRIKIVIEESDYQERVTKQLKDYQRKATVPGFRKGMAPMGLIQRMYKGAVVADEVQNVMSESLYKYISEEKLDIVGTPLANDELNGIPDFAKETSFTFSFDAALMPAINIDWSKIDVKLAQIKTTAKDTDKQIDYITRQNGKFETPETIGENDYIYGKVVELDKKGEVVEGGVSTFISFELPTVKDEEIRNSFVGKKAEEKVVFNAGKAFNAADIEKNFRIEATAAKKFKADVELTISGCSRITPHELNEELFNLVFPGQEIKTEDAFRKAVAKDINKANDEQCEILYVNQVRKALLDNFDATMPEAFLKRWILSRSDDKDLTAEKLDAEWNEKYLPSLKWEFLDGALNKIQSIEPTYDEILEYVKGIIAKNAHAEEGESAEDLNKRIEEAAKTIANDKNNSQQISDKIYVQKTAKLFRDQLKPEVEKISAKEFEERCKA